MAIKIFNPIWIKDNLAYFSISQWNFEKADKQGNLDIKVYSGDKLAGEGTINKKNWIKTAKLKEKKVVYRPDDPMVYYYNILAFKKPKTEEDKLREFSAQILS